MTTFKKIFVVSAMIGLMLPSFTFAAFGLEDASKGTGLIKAGSSVSKDAIPELIGSIIGVVLSFVGAIFFLLILYAGFLWMTAFGSSEKTDKAKSILEHAAIGLVIVLAAYAISTFVFNALTETTAPAANTGCCSNSATGNSIQTLESNCSGPTRTWVAGPCP